MAVRRNRGVRHNIKNKVIKLKEVSEIKEGNEVKQKFARRDSNRSYFYHQEKGKKGVKWYLILKARQLKSRVVNGLTFEDYVNMGASDGKKVIIKALRAKEDAKYNEDLALVRNKECPYMLSETYLKPGEVEIDDHRDGNSEEYWEDLLSL